jgi:hypothetical protein
MRRLTAALAIASNGIPNQAEGKRIKTAARVVLSKPGRFEGREVYRCFTLTIPAKPASDQHLCLKQQAGSWSFVSEPSSPPAAAASTDFLVRAIGGGCSMSALRVVCETYGTPAQVATLKRSGAVAICTPPGSASACGQGDFGEGRRTTVPARRSPRRGEGSWCRRPGPSASGLLSHARSAPRLRSVVGPL